MQHLLYVFIYVFIKYLKCLLVVYMVFPFCLFCVSESIDKLFI